MRRKYVRYITVVVFACFCTTTQVYAGSTAPDWISGQLYITSTQPNQTKGCFNGTEKQTVKLVRKDATTDNKYVELVECVLHGKGFDLLYGVTYVGNTGIVGIYAIKLEGDDVFRYLRLQQYSYRIAEGTDKLFVYDSSYQRMHVIRDVSSAVITSATSPQGETTEYTINTQLDNGHHYWISGASEITIDPSGTYLVYTHYYDDTLTKINTGDDTQQFIQLKPRALGATPYVRAVSSDGRFVYINGTERIVDTGDCVRPDEVFFSSCQERDLRALLADYAGNNFGTADATFHDDNFSLKFTTFPYDYVHVQQSINLSLRIDVSSLTYLALGDSYTSGEGDRENAQDGSSYYTPDTGDEGGCHLSTRSYPFLLRDLWGLKQDNMHSVACSGALVKNDYMTPIETYTGQHGELEEFGSKGRQGLIDAAYKYYVPGRIPQVEFVAKYKPSIITLSGGGNDVGFANIIRYCASDLAETLVFNYTCEYGEDGVLHQVLNDTIDSQYKVIRELVERMKAISPNSKIYYVGYPSFISTGPGGCALNSGILDSKERDMVNKGVTRLNNILRQVAADTGIAYVDIEHVLDGGRLCEGSEYVNGIWDVGIFGPYNEAFHPNAKGHTLIAQEIFRQINNPISSYKAEPAHAYIIQPITMTRQERMTNENIHEGEVLRVELQPSTFAGSSGIVTTGYSQTIQLGTYKSSPDGSFRVDIKLPASMAAGMHVLTLTGLSADGQPLRLFQYINVSKNQIPKPEFQNSVSLSNSTKSNSQSGDESKIFGLLSDAHGQSKYQSVLGGSSRQTIVPSIFPNLYTGNRPSPNASSMNNFLTLAILSLVPFMLGALYVSIKKDRK